MVADMEMNNILDDDFYFRDLSQYARVSVKLYIEYMKSNLYGKHIIKTYNIGCIGDETELNCESIINRNPINNIFKKHYNGLGDFSIGIDFRNSKIIPCYFKGDNFENFTDEMMNNKAMWKEMSECGLIESTYEYREDISMGIKYLEYKQKQQIEETRKPKKKWYQFWK